MSFTDTRCWNSNLGKRNPNFHDVNHYGKPHDTYRNQASYVYSTGNKWAIENFEATRPYFA